MVSVAGFFVCLTWLPVGTAKNFSYLDGCKGWNCLNSYVHHPDPTYTWRDTGNRLNGTALGTNVKWTGYVLNFTSQTWLTPQDSDRSVWWHIMVVIVPENYDPLGQVADWSSMYMTGGCNEGNPVPTDPKGEDLTVSSYLACHTGTIAATLYQIPACPITFKTDPIQKARTEDAIIAFTWQHFNKFPKNPEWLLRLPMTKAAVRGMDTIASFVKTLYPSAPKVKRFAVAGASKRGWTTWTTAAVDSRVKAAIPVVLDELNMVRLGVVNQ